MTDRLFCFLALLLAGCTTAGSRPAAPTSFPEGALRVGFVVVEGVYGSELVAPHDIFQHTIFHADPGMVVFTVAKDRRPLRTFEGLWLLPDHDFASAPPIDVLVVPSAEHNMDSDLEDEELISFVRERGRQARWVLSLCDGAFVLAQAGLLEGLETTTFPADRPRLREMFPGLVVHDEVSFVHDGNALTSAGGARSYEPALYLCELLWGAEVARGIASGLVIDWDSAEVPHRLGPSARFPEGS